MKEYLDLLSDVHDHGRYKLDRTKVGCHSVFGRQIRFDLSKGFPMVTTKKLHLRSIIHELLWFLKGDTNIAYLKENGVRIWDEWADANGDLGPIYGEQWRSWKDIDGRTHDQITTAIELLRKDPASRRNVVSAWNVGQLDQMRLNPCHALFQFYAEELTTDERVDIYNAKVEEARREHAGRHWTDQEMVTWAWLEKGREKAWNGQTMVEYLDAEGVPKHRLSCQLYQRSADIFLGVPFNIASYALLTHMVAHVVGMAPGDFVHTFGDLHVYSNHIDQIELQMTRDPLPLPKLVLNPDVKNIFDFTIDDIKIVGYESHPAIKGDVAV